jgi:hypothetical protein
MIETLQSAGLKSINMMIRDPVANITEQEWFSSKIPLAQQSKVTFDRGSEFIGKDFKKMIKKDYGVKGKTNC